MFIKFGSIIGKTRLNRSSLKWLHKPIGSRGGLECPKNDQKTDLISLCIVMKIINLKIC